MSIRVVCPNGHALQVKNEWAGKTGLCPTCKTPIAIPCPSGEDFSEESIMDLLGRPGAPRAAVKPAKSAEAVAAADARQQPPKKACDKCKQEIPKEVAICPYCRTFVGHQDEH
jgi:RNA polymerase subunit RPABC4/transcription elongation factor Spt4